MDGWMDDGWMDVMTEHSIVWFTALLFVSNAKQIINVSLIHDGSTTLNNGAMALKEILFPLKPGN